MAEHLQTIVNEFEEKLKEAGGRFVLLAILPNGEDENVLISSQGSNLDLMSLFLAFFINGESLSLVAQLALDTYKGDFKQEDLN